MSKGLSISKINIGDEAIFSKIITSQDVELFAQITGDLNPVHLDEEYASQTIFKKRIAHGMLISSLFSTILGTKLPGEGTIYLGQELKFTKPVYLNDTITAKAVVVEKNIEKNRLKIETNAYNQNNELVITGYATVMPPK